QTTFSKKMTDLESPKKNNDCYFYYYSTCAKGDNCTFRHEPSALGCETMCSFWKEGKCLNVHCNFRHMELRKNRKVIPCYWESQPVGCLKAHCPFLHQNPRPSDEVSPDKSNISTGNCSYSNTDAMLKEQMNQPSERKVTAVDSLVVNFEEGQDPVFHAPSSNGNDLRQRIIRRIISKELPQERTVTIKTYPHERIKTNKRLSNDELATILGDESLRKKQKIVHQKNDGNFQIVLKKRLSETDASSELNDELCTLRMKKSKTVSDERQEPPVENIKIKTLDEIRAERNAKREYLYITDDSKSKVITAEEKEEAEVSSTSIDDTVNQSTNDTLEKQIKDNIMPRRKIKLRRKLPTLEESTVLTYDKDENRVSTNNIRLNAKEEDELLSSEDEDKILEEEEISGKLQSKDFERRFTEIRNSNKIEDEVLLLEEDDDEYENVTLKAEEELLNEIDSD
ncbi:hypothetical protein NQ314_005257, partial [Rhamnusium bicolor]